MEWLSSSHRVGIKQPVQISVYETLSVGVNVRVRVFVMRYQYSAIVLFRDALKDIEGTVTVYLSALFSRAPSTQILPRPRAPIRRVTAHLHGWPFAQSKQGELFALRLMDEILHHFEPSHAFILCFPLHPLALILVVSIC